MQQPDKAAVAVTSDMRHWPKVCLGGLPITRTTMEQTALSFVAHALEARERQALPFYSTSANGQVLAVCAKQPELQKLIMKADQIHADGMPMVLYSKLFSYQPVNERVATTDLVHAVANHAQKAGIRFYFLGGSEEVNARAVAAMQALYPDLIFAGRRNGYFCAAEEKTVVEQIVAAKTDILWVGLGFPLEQAFTLRNLERLRGVGIVKTSGGLFDFLSGKNKRAPQWMQNAGLEWAFRLWLEPRRLFMRYLVTNPVALHVLFRRSR